MQMAPIDIGEGVNHNERLVASLSRLRAFYGAMDAKLLLHAIIKEEFKGKVALFSSFGADAALLIAFVAEVDPTIPVLFLETGKHFPETLEYVQAIKKQLGLTNLQLLRPDPKLLLNTDPKGELWQTQPNRCCWMRKVEPLARAIEEQKFEAIITGRKKFQTQERHELHTIELHEDNTFRINPLVNWSKAEIRQEFLRRELPQHPLVNEGYPSIGCAPCTTPVKPGEDERAGRWRHTIDLLGKQKQECGIHIEEAQSNPDWSV